MRLLCTPYKSQVKLVHASWAAVSAVQYAYASKHTGTVWDYVSNMLRQSETQPTTV